MKKIFDKKLNKFRMRSPQVPEMYRSHDSWGPVGFFLLLYRPTPQYAAVGLRAMSTNGSSDCPWEHISVSLPDRVPTWNEMCFVKDAFWDEDEVVIQYHPAKDQYVNHHPFCLHLWKPTGAGVIVPVPPVDLVGPVIRDNHISKMIDEVCKPFTS